MSECPHCLAEIPDTEVKTPLMFELDEVKRHAQNGDLKLMVEELRYILAGVLAGDDEITE